MNRLAGAKTCKLNPKSVKCIAFKKTLRSTNKLGAKPKIGSSNPLQKSMSFSQKIKAVMAKTAAARKKASSSPKKVARIQLLMSVMTSKRTINLLRT